MDAVSRTWKLFSVSLRSGKRLNAVWVSEVHVIAAGLYTAIYTVQFCTFTKRTRKKNT